MRKDSYVLAFRKPIATIFARVKLKWVYDARVFRVSTDDQARARVRTILQSHRLLVRPYACDPQFMSLVCLDSRGKVRNVEYIHR